MPSKSWSNGSVSLREDDTNRLLVLTPKGWVPFTEMTDIGRALVRFRIKKDLSCPFVSELFGDECSCLEALCVCA